MKVSWEAWIGTNFMFYPNGNSYRSQPASKDPQGGLADVIQLGYKAACDGKLACAGDLTVEMLDDIIGRFLNVGGAAAARVGLPRSKVFTHVGCDWGRQPRNMSLWNSPRAGVVSTALPGWSLYDFAFNPSLAGGTFKLDVRE